MDFLERSVEQRSTPRERRATISLAAFSLRSLSLQGLISPRSPLHLGGAGFRHGGSSRKVHAAFDLVFARQIESSFTADRSAR